MVSSESDGPGSPGPSSTREHDPPAFGPNPTTCHRLSCRSPSAHSRASECMQGDDPTALHHATPPFAFPGNRLALRALRPVSAPSRSPSRQGGARRVAGSPGRQDRSSSLAQQKTPRHLRTASRPRPSKMWHVSGQDQVRGDRAPRTRPRREMGQARASPPHDRDVAWSRASKLLPMEP